MWLGILSWHLILFCHWLNYWLGYLFFDDLFDLWVLFQKSNYFIFARFAKINWTWVVKVSHETLHDFGLFVLATLILIYWRLNWNNCLNSWGLVGYHWLCINNILIGFRSWLNLSLLLWFLAWWLRMIHDWIYGLHFPLLEGFLVGQFTDYYRLHLSEFFLFVGLYLG